MTWGMMGGPSFCPLAAFWCLLPFHTKPDPKAHVSYNLHFKKRQHKNCPGLRHDADSVPSVEEQAGAGRVGSLRRQACHSAALLGCPGPTGHAATLRGDGQAGPFFRGLIPWALGGGYLGQASLLNVALVTDGVRAISGPGPAPQWAEGDAARGWAALPGLCRVAPRAGDNGTLATGCLRRHRPGEPDTTVTSSGPGSAPGPPSAPAAQPPSRSLAQAERP